MSSSTSFPSISNLWIESDPEPEEEEPLPEADDVGLDSPILLLPPEVRTPIWALLSPESAKNIRFTCKTFKTEIDNGVGLCIDLDERLFTARDILSTLPPSASSLRIFGNTVTHDYLSRLLYNSRLLTAITFSGPTDVSQVKKVLTRCPNLESVTLTDHVQFDTRFLIPFKLRNVRTLHLGAREVIRKGGARNFIPPSNSTSTLTNWTVYSDLLTNLGFPCLKCLRLEYTLPPDLSSGPGYAAMFRTILKYLCAHKTVNDLTLRLHKGMVTSAPELAPPPPQPQARSKVGVNVNVNANARPNLPKNGIFLQLDPKEESQLLSFTSFRRLILSTDPEIGKIWEKVLLVQKHLQVLDYLNQGTDWIFFSKIIKNNRNSLQIVRLRRLLPDEGPLPEQARVDLAAFEFESCSNLKELFLSRFENSTREVCLRARFGGQRAPILPYLDRAGSQFPELIRFRAIPASLERLHIQGFTVKTDDLLTLPERMTKLKVLELQLLGYNPGKVNQLEYPGSDLKFLRQEEGSGDWDSAHDLEVENIQKNLKRMSQTPKDISQEGFGTTPAVLRKILTKLRTLDTLFIEEFHNNRTELEKEHPDFGRALKKVNIIPGDCRLKALGYYGVLVARKEGGTGNGWIDSSTSGWNRMESTERGDNWGMRFNQYRFQHRMAMGRVNSKPSLRRMKNRPL